MFGVIYILSVGICLFISYCQYKYYKSSDKYIGMEYWTSFMMGIVPVLNTFYVVMTVVMIIIEIITRRIS